MDCSLLTSCKLSEEISCRLERTARIALYLDPPTDDLPTVAEAEVALHHYFLLCGGAVKITKLLAAFHAAEGRLKGPEGVCSLLQTTRNGVYARLEQIGLSAQDFRESRVTVDSLLGKSSMYGPLLQKYGLVSFAFAS